ncbi:hypothetical protein NM208_g4909 [Fusarium decemcellulare]|uniref:Uncharacterized protein n=1 Tax=Fusarium decemcellulare TaxID=57161 RepID=A0ACC1SJ63_9HYPO|nr:hypothetical protein NM208_g4909 [Fusarium decemcellulare]
MHASAVFYYGVLFLQGALASPIAEPAPEAEHQAIEPRSPKIGDIPFPQFPKKGAKKTGGSDCPTGGGNQQSNLCSSGNPYCCSGDGNGGHICQQTTACQTTIICCNNNNGYQICIGDIDFNMPITINISL